jgi:FKBP-type peptidyl-prolyl cis-trans isomerase FkpA
MKLKNLVILAVFTTAIMLSACNTGSENTFESTESGLQFSFVEEGDGNVPEIGQILLLNMAYVTADDSLLFSTDMQGGPVPVQIDTTSQGPIQEGFNMLQGGDSVIFKINAEDVFVNTFNTQVPDFISPESDITFNIGVEDVMTEEDFQAYQMEMMRKQQEDMLAQQTEQMSIDSTKIETYLSDNNIDAQTTASGLRYTIQQEGTGPSPSAGDTVYVHYTGKLLNGEQFDSSYDRGEPLAFPIGQGMVIPGWDEGIALLQKGGEATLYIPSPLAYGPQARGDIIKENSILVFDVELVDVKQASS